MMKLDGNIRRARRARRFKRAIVTVSGALLLVPFLPGRAAFQDVASLVAEGAAPRWQAHLLTPASLPAPETKSRDRLSFHLSPPAEAAVNPGAAAGLSLDEAAPVPAPATARLTSGAKSGRLTPTEASAGLPPKNFSAGSILERQSLFSPHPGTGDDRVALAFAKIDPEVVGSVEIAAYFKMRSEDAREGRPDAATPGVAVASLEPTVGGTNALGYADPNAGAARTGSLFENVLRETPEAFVPPIGEKDHAWAATPLPASVFSAKEQLCLANGIYFEARGESELGQAAVAQVILNRVRNPVYPKTICGVVYQNKNWRNRCQFSFACDGKPDRVHDLRAFRTAKRIAESVTRGETWITEVGSSTHYHARYVHPRWANAMEQVDRIGKHIFYRTYNGGL